MLIGLLTSLLSLVYYSKKELTNKQLLLRKCLHLVLVEFSVMLLFIFQGGFKDFSEGVFLALVILVIWIAVNLCTYLASGSMARKMTKGLKQYQQRRL